MLLLWQPRSVHLSLKAVSKRITSVLFQNEFQVNDYEYEGSLGVVRAEATSKLHITCFNCSIAAPVFNLGATNVSPLTESTSKAKEAPSGKLKLDEVLEKKGLKKINTKKELLAAAKLSEKRKKFRAQFKTGTILFFVILAHSS